MYRQAGGGAPSGVSRHGQEKRPPRASRTGKRRAQRPPQPRSAAAPHGETKKGITEKTYKEAKLRPSTKARLTARSTPTTRVPEASLAGG